MKISGLIATIAKKYKTKGYTDYEIKFKIFNNLLKKESDYFSRLLKVLLVNLFFFIFTIVFPVILLSIKYNNLNLTCMYCID